MSKMKILAISDIEGRMFKGLKGFCKRNKVDAIISAGDFSTSCTKMVFDNWELLGNWTNENRKKFDKKYGFAQANKKIKKSHDQGIKVLKMLNSLDIPVYVILGNQDYVDKQRSGKSFRKKDFIKLGSQLPYIRKMKNVHYVHNKSRKLGDYRVVGKSTGYSTGGRHFSKRPIILVTHTPAYGTRFGRVKNKASPRNGEQVGSEEVRFLIDSYEPFLHICGHMHEHWGKTRVGKTISIASGFGFRGQATLIELNGKKVKTKLVRIR